MDCCIVVTLKFSIYNCLYSIRIDVLMTPIEEEPAVDVEGNAKDEEKKQNDPNEIRRKSTNLRKLIKVAIHKAKVTNPVLFELPKSFQTNPYNFPGNFQTYKSIGSLLMK